MGAKSSSISFVLFAAALCMLSATGPAAARIDLDWQPLPTAALPPSVQVFQSTAALPGNRPIRAFYALIDLNDPNVELDVAYVGDNGARITPVEEMQNADEPVYIAANGGFFGATTSLVPIVDDGRVLAFGQQGVARNGSSYFPTWGAWGFDQNRDSEVVWAWGAAADGSIFAFDAPYPNSLLEVPLPVPALLPPFATAPDGRPIPAGRIWDAVEAMGGTPVLIKDGVLLDLDESATSDCAADPNITLCNELVNDPGLTGPNPRTAIGISADRKQVMLLVIDGRSAESVGATIKETGEILLAIGAVDGLNLDGGGSSTLIANDFDGVLAAPASGNGGNSADVLNTPSDGFMRPVAMSLLVKRRPQFFDNLPALPNYSESGGSWFATASPGSFPDSASPTRLAATVGSGNAPTDEARFDLDGIAPAQYEVSAWWVGGFNRASNAPFTIERAGFDPLVVRRDQTGATPQFNLLGTFHLGPDDAVRLGNNADGDTSPSFVAADAIRLRRVGESVPDIIFGGGDSANAISGDSVTSTITIASPNSGVSPTGLKVYKSVDGGGETLFDEIAYGGDRSSETYDLVYEVSEAPNSSVVLRLQVEDNLGHVVSENFSINVLSFDFQFDPPVLEAEQAAGRAIEFDMVLNTGTPALTLSQLEVFVSRNGGLAESVETIALSGSSLSVPFSYLVAEAAGTELTFIFVATAADGSTVETEYSAGIVPARGDFVIGFVSDMNGSFGSTSYDESIRQAFSFFVDQGVDAVFSGGDMVAGQCASATACDEDAMWAGFDAELYGQLKNAAIPFLFTLQNHDAANPWDIEGALSFWNNPANVPQGMGVELVDNSDYPRNYSALLDFDLDGRGDVFFVSVFNPGDDLNAAELAFLEATLSSAAAQSARLRVVAAGQPLYAISAPRNTAGFLTGPRDAITDILRRGNVNLYVSGDSAAYFPGKRFDIQLLSLAEMAGTGKAYIGESQVPPTAVTRADIFIDDPFYGKNAIVFTTYDTRSGFSVVREDTLPTALFDFDGDFVMRDDVPVGDSGSTTLSSLNLTAPFVSAASGSASIELDGSSVQIRGSFAGLQSPLLPYFDAVGLYRGRHGEPGELVAALTIDATDGYSGTFSGSLAQTADTRDTLAVGAYYIAVKSEAHPGAALRGQLFNTATSSAPQAPGFVDIAPGDTVEVRDVPALLEIAWSPAQDREKSPITYVYQLSSSADFADSSVLLSESVGRETLFRGLSQSQWLAFLGGASQLTLYQRIIASDGQSVVVGAPQSFVLTEASGPLQGPVTIPTPDFEFQGVFATMGAGFRGYDVAIDEASGRIWACTLAHGPYVYNADGSHYELTDSAIGYGVDEFGNRFVNAIDFNAAAFRDGTCYGVEYDPQGYVLLALDRDLFKLDATTGEPVAFWDSDSLFGFETNPSLADDGTIFGHDVFPGNRAFILRPSAIDPSTFEIVREFDSANPPALSVSGSVSRSSAYSPEGDRIYLPPTSSSPFVSIYSTENGSDWQRRENYEMPAPTGSDAIYAGPGQTMWVINEKSAFPPNLVFADFNRQFTWNLFLDEIEESDLRGFTVSRDGRTFYVTGAQAIYKYAIADGAATQPPLISLAQASAIDSDGAALRAGERVRVQAVVTTGNYADNGLAFFAEDVADEIRIFAGLNGFGYTPVVGDLLEITGLVQQSLGQLSIVPDTLTVLDTQRPLRPRPLVTAIDDESLESRVVTVAAVGLVDPNSWSNSGFPGFDAGIDAGACGAAAGAALTLFIGRASEVFGNPAPEGCFNVTGVVQQRGEEYLLAPLSSADIALTGRVDMRLLRRVLPGTGEPANFLAVPMGLGRPANADFSWYRNGIAVAAGNAWESLRGRVFVSRTLKAGDRISVRVASPASVYPYTSDFVELGLAPLLNADTDDNSLGQAIEIEFDANPAWVEQVFEVNVGGRMLATDQYRLESDRIVLQASAFAASGTFEVAILANGYKVNTVRQVIVD